MRFDPRVKIIWVLLLTTLAIAFRSAGTLSILFAVTFLFALVFGVRLPNVLRQGKRFIQLLLIIVLVQLIFVRSGTPIITVGGLTILTSGGIQGALQFLLRYSVIILAGFIMATSTSRESIQALVQLKVPYFFVFMVVITIKFIPLLYEAFSDVMVAIQLRGVEIGALPLKKRFTVYGYILVPVIGIAISSAKDLAITMEARGFGAYSTRTSFRSLKFSASDAALIVLCALSAATILGAWIWGLL